jgi:hypothetical protein
VIGESWKIPKNIVLIVKVRVGRWRTALCHVRQRTVLLSSSNRRFVSGRSISPLA